MIVKNRRRVDFYTHVVATVFFSSQTPLRLRQKTALHVLGFGATAKGHFQACALRHFGAFLLSAAVAICLNSLMIRRGRREGSILLSFLLFYGLMVGKYALICAMEIQKIHMVVHIFSGFALVTELMCGVESLCKLLTANKVPFDLPTKE